MNGHHDPQSRIDSFQFFTGQTQGNIIHTLSTIAHRQAHTQNAQFRHTLQNEWSHLLGTIIILYNRGNFALGELAHHLLHHAMFVGKGKIHTFPPFWLQVFRIGSLGNYSMRDPRVHKDPFNQCSQL